MKRISILITTLAICASAAFQGLAQTPVPPPAPEVQLRSSAELDQMLGPIALYPDPLIAQILPAATLPSQIVMADRYLTGGGDPNLIDQQPWDPSVKALARYPTVLTWMDENLAWTTAVGEAFLYQQQDVMDSIQRLRAQALALGNLQTTPQQTVINDNGTIEIVPANPEVVYLPVYQPDVVYYQRPYGAPFITFGAGLVVGAWLNHDFDWHAHHLIVWHHDQPRPRNWWYQRPSQRPREEHVTVWQPRNHPAPGARDIDRGWDSRQVHNTVTVIGSQPRPPERRSTPAPPPQRHEPVVTQHPANGALIGVQSSHETRQFSSRGQESRQAAISRPAPFPSHAAPPAHSEAPSRQPGGGRH